MASGLSRSRSTASAASPLIMVARAVPSAAPGTPQPKPNIVTVWPNSSISRVGLMRKKLKKMSSTQTSTLMRLGVRASPVARSMAEYIPMAMLNGRAADQMPK